MADRYLELWMSGELKRLAAGCRTAKELAEKLGVSVDALGCGLRRHRHLGVPSPTALLEQAHSQFASREGGANHLHLRTSIDDSYPLIANDDGYIDEKTEPGIGPGIAVSPDEYETSQRRAAIEELEPLEEHRLKRKVSELEAANRELMERLLNTQDALGVAREASQHRVAPLDMRERSSGLREACSLLLVSDNHLDEIVTLESVNGLNEHNPDIARDRMARVFQGARWLNAHARQSHIVRDIIVWLGGDHISGTIHDDLRETNAMSLPESIAFAQQVMGDGLRHLLEDAQVETLRVVCSTGNHGRLAPGKPRIHTRNETNAETILFLSLAREFANDPRVSFDLPAGVFTYLNIYEWCARFSHGDSFKYGGAMAGIMNSINRGIARLNRARRADLDCVAHWHQYGDSPTLITNGSTVGYGTFSEWIHAPWERPQQAWTLLDSKRWRSMSAVAWAEESDQRAA